MNEEIFGVADYVLLEQKASSFDLLYYSKWGAAVLLVAGLVFLALRLYRSWGSRRNYKALLEAYEAIPKADAKAAAYRLSAIGRALADDERKLRIYEELYEALEPYKYKKEVAPLSDEVWGLSRNYLRICSE